MNWSPSVQLKSLVMDNVGGCILTEQIKKHVYYAYVETIKIVTVPSY